MSTVAEVNKTAATTTTTTDALSAEEKQSLARCETAIVHHFETYRTAGAALAEIRDKRLYREAFPTFESYCRVKWDMSKTQANRLIAAAGVVRELQKSGSPELAKAAEHLTESAIRPLTLLQPNQAKKVLQRVAKKSPGLRGVTAKAITEAAKVVAPDSFKRQTAPVRRDGIADLVRRSEAIDSIREWQKEQNKAGKFSGMKPAQVTAAVIKLLKSL